MPAFTTSRPGKEFSPGQLIFAAVASLLLYLLFVFTQTVRHRDFFLPILQKGQKRLLEEDESHADPPSNREGLTSLLLLLVAPTPTWVLVAFAGLGAGPAGFNMSSQTMVLEFGARDDVPMRLGLSQTAQGLVSTVGPLIGGVIAWLAGFSWVLELSIAFEAVALGLLVFVVDEPRYRRRNA